MASQERIRPVIKGSGFWHVPTVKEYSKETQELLKVMMQESKLTCFQQRHLVNCMKRGDALPIHCYPTSSREPEFPKLVLPKVILTTSPFGRPHLRPAEICRAGNAYIREKFKPQATRDLEKEKERLQNILATGKDKVEKKTRPVKIEETVQEMDRFDELVNEIQDRQNFLAEMEALGQSKVYQGIIQTEISQMLREMEMIDKQRTAELKGAIAKSFNVNIKHDNPSTGQVDQ
ncbi:PREDICTED: UPF0193 protein EVG1 [Thamnophis sirtalis]|uniref:UPF0193 protein EVG1 n=1 Tax=Thamnophis sirtalis TaxID=35019 RepID=A0A6I9Y0X5_9SAUR|nr:PREDICTED: UPF0193 protein EVG1 [Thamnophis sirtalis]XP_013910401.1 PREDICTED: UPF0193 protein EVG1 [Thamnophis sirtalis]